MEETSILDQLLPLLLPIALTAGGAFLGFFWGRLKGYAAASEATWDDDLIKLVEDTVLKHKDSDPPSSA